MYHDKNGWTPIYEAFPLNGQECFVWYLLPEEPYSGSWCYTAFINGEFDVFGVTHWRPVFKPPIQKEKKCQH